MDFHINKNSTLPLLKLDVINDGRNDMSKIYEMIQNSNIFFKNSATNEISGTFTIYGCNLDYVDLTPSPGLTLPRSFLPSYALPEAISLTAFNVFGPKTPSAVKFNFFCKLTTSFPFDPSSIFITTLYLLYKYINYGKSKNNSTITLRW